jgi:hypothetical protein
MDIRVFGIPALVELALFLVPVGLNAYLAGRRRQSIWLWALLGAVFPWLSTLVLLLFFRKKG